MNFEYGTTCWNGLFVRLVEAGTPILDPKGKQPPIIVEEQNVAVVGKWLYCTKSMEDKLVARLKELKRA